MFPQDLMGSDGRKSVDRPFGKEGFWMTSVKDKVKQIC
jgi:hypothetical protein